MDLLPEYHAILREMFDYDRPIPPPYKLIARLTLYDHFKAILTTNFDEKLDDAFKYILRRESNLFLKSVVFASGDSDYNFYKEKRSDKIKGLKVKLHGTLSKPYTIRSSENDMQKLSDQKHEVFKRIFEENPTIIFLGYSCRDPDIYHTLTHLNGDNQIFWIGHSKIPPPKALEVLKHFGLEKNEYYLGECDAYKFLKMLHDDLIKSEQLNFSMITFPEKNFLNHYGPKIIPKLKEKKSFIDPIYGEIDFDVLKDYADEISVIINSADMQRLRDIKQLSFVQYRHPGATHTRFQHSLGVAYLTSKVLDRFLERQIIKEPKIVLDCVYAALLHDVGHGPFGHVIDTFAERLGRRHEINHEFFSKKFIREGLIDLKEMHGEVHYDEATIESLITSKDLDASHLFLNWLICDYALDVDRWDFLLRDLYFTGLASKYKNQYDQSTLGGEIITFEGRKNIIEKLINYLDVVPASSLEIETDIPDDSQILAFKNHADSNLLIRSFLQLYSFMYSNVYHSETNLCAQAMMAKALQLGWELKEININELYKFTDSGLFSYLENMENSIIRELVWGVKYRRLFQNIETFKPPENCDALRLENQIKDELNLNENEYKNLLLVAIPPVKNLTRLYLTDGKKTKKFPDIEKYSKYLNNQRRGYIFVPWDSKIKKAILQKILGEHQAISSSDGLTRWQ